MARVQLGYKVITEPEELYAGKEMSDLAHDLVVQERLDPHEYNLYTAVGKAVVELLGHYEVVEVTARKLEE